MRRVLVHASPYRKGATIHVSSNAGGDFCVVHSTGAGFRFAPTRIGAFITSNGFGARLASALEHLAVGDAVAIFAKQQRIVVCRPNGNEATIRRRFRLTRDIL